MKTIKVASGILGALAIAGAMGLTACSAETGEQGAIGETSQALATTPVKLTGADDPTDLTAANGQERDHASSCRMKDANGEYFVIAGGFDGTPTALRSILLSKANNGFTKQTALLPVGKGRGDGKMIRISDTECWFIGGTTAAGAATAQTQVDVLTLVAPVPPATLPTIAVNAGGTPQVLQQARSNFEVSTCTDNGGGLHVVVFGGLDSGGSGALNSVEVSPVVTGIFGANPWVKTNAVLQAGRYDFGLAKEKTTDNYIAVAGHTGSATYDATIDIITMTKSSTTCTPSGTPAVDSFGFPVTLPTAIEGNVAYPESNANTFQVSAGAFDNSGTRTLYTLGKKLTVNFGTAVTTVAAGAAPATPTYRPVLVETDLTNHGTWALVGGKDAASANSIAAVQHFTTGSGFAAAATGLTPPMYRGVAEYFPNTNAKSSGGANGIVIAATGRDIAGATPLPLTVEAWQ